MIESIARVSVEFRVIEPTLWRRVDVPLKAVFRKRVAILNTKVLADFLRRLKQRRGDLPLSHLQRLHRKLA